MSTYSIQPHTIGIYTGAGASHSWTWFVETLEDLNSVRLVYLNENDIIDDALNNLDMLMTGGGDVYGMAEGLGPAGAAKIEKFVQNGGTYLGSCAGAYLVMESINLPPYTPFNLIDADMSNYSVAPPVPLAMPHKYKVPYGGGFVYHPAYGPVKVALKNNANTGLGREITAPLYGGPVIFPGEGTRVLARYISPERGCFRLVHDEELLRLLVNGCAGACAAKGNGKVYIFGPHFECPSFPDGRFVIEDILQKNGMATEKNGSPVSQNQTLTKLNVKQKKHLRVIKGELSNARIVAFGLERMPVTWSIGTKVWEPEKVRYYIEFNWRRLNRLAQAPCREGLEKDLEKLAEGAVTTRMLIRQLKNRIDNNEDTTELADDLFNHLKHQTVKLLQIG